MTSPNRHERRRARALTRSSQRSSQRSSPPDPRPHRFVEGWARATKSKRPDLELAVLGTVLRNTWSRERLRTGGWISHAVTEVYLHSPVAGFGPARTLGLIARFVDFLHAEGTLGAWSHKHLRHRVERERVAHRLNEGPPTSEGHDESVGSWELERVATLFATTLTHPIDREIGAGVVTLTAMALKAQQGDGDTQFGALDVAGLVSECLLPGATAHEQGANAAFLRILAEFYVWRGAEGRLDPARATELATELRAAALAHGALRFQA